MNSYKRQAIFDRLAATIPDPTTELRYSGTFELLIAVVLSAQATDKSVNKATQPLFAIANTPEAMLALGLDGLKQYIRTIGLYNSKAENIMIWKKLARIRTITLFSKCWAIGRLAIIIKKKPFPGHGNY